MTPLGNIKVDETLDDVRALLAPTSLPFAVLYWKDRDGGLIGVTATFAERCDADDWARQTAHSDLHNDTCERAYAVVERDTRKVLTVERCRGGRCRCTERDR